MSSRLDRNSIKQKQTLGVALVDADVSLHHAVREHCATQETGWQVEAYTNAAEALKAIPTTRAQSGKRRIARAGPRQCRLGSVTAGTGSDVLPVPTPDRQGVRGGVGNLRMYCEYPPEEHLPKAVRA
jgi:hypothetical protein